MAGYANRVIHILFPELAEDDDPVWVAIRNPRTQPPGVLQPDAVPVDDEGKPLNPADAMGSMYRIIARLIIGARLYDATVEDLDPETGRPLDQPLLTAPWTAEKVQRFPMEVITKIGKEIREGINPSP